jgi:hypothetical protein
MSKNHEASNYVFIILLSFLHIYIVSSVLHSEIFLICFLSSEGKTTFPMHRKRIIRKKL